MREFKPLLGLDELNKMRMINLQVLTIDGKETMITVAPGDHIKVIKEKLLGEAGAKDLPSYKVSVRPPFLLMINPCLPSRQNFLEKNFPAGYCCLIKKGSL